MDKFSNWFPAASICIIVFSFLNMTFYYSQFGIVIHHYVEVSEIIFSLTGFTASLIALLIIGTVYFFFPDNRKRGDTESTEELKLYSKLKYHRVKILRKFAELFSRMAISIFLATITIGVFIYYINTSYTDKELLESVIMYDIMGFLFSFLLSAYVALCSIWFRKKKDIDNKAVYLMFISFALSLIFAAANRSVRGADLIKKGYAKYSVNLKTDKNENYKTTDTILYVGATKNFYFLYDKIKDESLIIPAGSVVEVKIHSLRGGL